MTKENYSENSSVYQTDTVYSGFRLMEKRFVQEVNAECLYFEHVKSGARLLKIAASDPNKLFSIAFKTLPENDFGTPHILEHSVLNGSESFPVKSPFDILIKGSLNTFLNAMTSSDYTVYPVASMNMTDYFNLMYVYLDAVFNPLMLRDSRILKQEGWHFELPEKDAPLTYKGVVYNEMKGAYSDPMTELYFRIGRNLFPDNTYGCESGGHPDEIPRLTQEYFTSFYRKFYHPSNSYIFLYGDADLDRELKFIDEKYLSGYQRLEVTPEIPLQKPLPEMKVAECTYAVPGESPVRDNTYLCLSFVTNENTDRTTTMAFNLIANALVNHESAPVRLALQNAGIGREVMGWFSESMQNLFTILVQNGNPEDRDRFREVVFSTLKQVVTGGFDATAIEGILNRTEFNLKEGDYSQKGLICLFRNQQPWMYSGNPFLGLEYNKPLSENKLSADTRFLEFLVDKYLVNNPHSLLLTLKPEPGLQSEKDRLLAEELAAFKAGLSEAQVDSLVKETQQLIQFQQSEDTPEAIATIPMLALSDISEEAEYYPVETKDVSGVPIMFCNQFTNGIVYTNWYFDLRTIPQNLIPYASFLSSLLGKLSTEKFPFGDLDNQLNIHTGNFYAELSNFMVNRNDTEMMPKFTVSAKSTLEKTGKMVDLILEILHHSEFTDADRLKSVLVRLQSNMDADIRQNGLNYARMRASSYTTNSGMFAEMINGLDYYRFLTDISMIFDQKSPEIIRNIQETAALIFNRKNLIISVTCSQTELPVFLKEGERAMADWQEEPVLYSPWKFDYHNRNEAMLSASKVQYVVKGYNFKKLGYEWNGKLSVLNQIISTEWLQNQIRVIGGAYGGFSSFSPYGAAYFMSYRDPNLSETLQNYDATSGFLENFSAGETAMTRFIIGTIARLDQPRTTSQKGKIAMQCYFEKTTHEMLRKERQEILSTTVEDIREMKNMVKDILAQNTWCVYGNEAKIKENKDLFNELIIIDK